jgi:hypothetical protein
VFGPMPTLVSACSYALIAAVIYLGLALWAMRAILPMPATTFAYPSYFDRPELQGLRSLIQSDQAYGAWHVTRNAWTLITKPWNLFDDGQCYPLANAVTLGQPLFAEGLLGVFPYLLTGSPILTFNSVVVLTAWLSALAMYTLAYSWTRNVSAAFTAGFLFGLHPARLSHLPYHPFVIGSAWTVLALLFAHWLFRRQRWGDMAGLTLCAGLQMLESFYPLFTLIILGGVYSLYLIRRHWRLLPCLAFKLLVFGAVTATMAILVLRPYLETRAMWGILSGRGGPFFHQPSDFAFGGVAYPGTVLLFLSVVGLLDRLRGARRGEGYDPRFVYLTGGLMSFWASMGVISVLGIHVPSLFMLLASVVPGPDAVRAPALVRFGGYLMAAFLAAYGVVALTERRRAITRGMITITIVLVAGAEVFYPPLAQFSFGRTVEMKAYDVKPAAEMLEIYTHTEAGAVLDLPFKAVSAQAAYHVFLSAFHRQPVAACYNSFASPIAPEIEALAARLPDGRAADALYALGFRTVVVHEDELGSEQQAALYLANLTQSPSDGTRLVASGTAPKHKAYRLEQPTPVEASFSALEARGETQGIAQLVPPQSSLPFVFRSQSAATYRHPPPIEPTWLVVRWYAASGEVIAQHRVRTLLPLALAPGEETERAVTLPVPSASGEHLVTLSPAATPDLVIAKRRVSVAPLGTAGSRLEDSSRGLR